MLKPGFFLETAITFVFCSYNSVSLTLSAELWQNLHFMHFSIVFITLTEKFDGGKAGNKRFQFRWKYLKGFLVLPFILACNKCRDSSTQLAPRTVQQCFLFKLRATFEFLRINWWLLIENVERSVHNCAHVINGLWVSQ